MALTLLDDLKAMQNAVALLKKALDSGNQSDAVRLAGLLDFLVSDALKLAKNSSPGAPSIAVD